MDTTTATNWIAIAGITIQVIFAIWDRLSKREKTETPIPAPAAKSPADRQSSQAWFMRNSAPFLIGAAFCVALICAMASSTEPVSRASLGWLALVVVWLNINLISIVLYALSAIFRPTAQAVTRMAEKTAPKD